MRADFSVLRHWNHDLVMKVCQLKSACPQAQRAAIYKVDFSLARSKAAPEYRIERSTGYVNC